MTLTVHDELCLGLDIGTSGVRAVATDRDGRLAAEARLPLPTPDRDGARLTQDPLRWWQAALAALQDLCARIDRKAVRAIAVDGTSGTMLVCDAEGAPIGTGWMYNDASCTAEAARIAVVAPADSPARGASSPLARLLHLQALHPQATHALHQADWIAGRLAGRPGIADENNVLKLGYDVVERRWPAWYEALGVRSEWLPEVVPPGTPIGMLTPPLAAQLGLPRATVIGAGTTDGVAAFLATGASEVGDAVTSLGSTLVVKLLSDRPVFAAAYGLYSHRLGNLWLPGGASNSGGAALLQHYTPDQMTALTPRLEPDRPTGLDYYPLPAPGERFPIHDPSLAPRVGPRPADDVHHFQALLEGVAGVEQLAYHRMAELGAPALRRVYTVGGGARNEAWTRIRSRCLGVPVLTPPQDEAAVGAARLARQAWDAVRSQAAAGARA